MKKTSILLMSALGLVFFANSAFAQNRKSMTSYQALKFGTQTTARAIAKTGRQAIIFGLKPVKWMVNHPKTTIASAVTTAYIVSPPFRAAVNAVGEKALDVGRLVHGKAVTLVRAHPTAAIVALPAAGAAATMSYLGPKYFNKALKP